MVQYREGDVVIGVLVRVHNRGKNTVTCNETLPDGIQEIETVNLLVDMVSTVVIRRIYFISYISLFKTTDS